jgi:UPF0716 family protein affecting phage T7 exclusion
MVMGFNNGIETMPILFFWLLVEVLALIAVGEWIGFGWALLIIVLSSIFGYSMLRSQAMVIMQRFQKATQKGNADQLRKSIGREVPILMMAWFAFMIPGLFSDVIALAFLFAAAKQRFFNHNPPSTPKKDDALEGECWENESQTNKLDDHDSSEKK